MKTLKTLQYILLILLFVSAAYWLCVLTIPVALALITFFVFVIGFGGYVFNKFEN